MRIDTHYIIIDKFVLKLDNRIAAYSYVQSKGVLKIVFLHDVDST